MSCLRRGYGTPGSVEDRRKWGEVPPLWGLPEWSMGESGLRWHQHLALRSLAGTTPGKYQG